MKRVITILTLLSVASFFVVIGMRGHLLAYLLGISLPIISIIYAKLSNGQVHFFDRKNGPPSVFLPIILPAAAIGFVGFSEFYIYDTKKSLLYALILSIVFIAIILMGNKEIDLKKIRTYLLTFVFWIVLWFYSHGLVVIANGYGDTSTPQTFTAKVLDKEKRKARLMNYYLTIGPWHTRTRAREIEVEQPFYDRTNINDDINITLRKGRLGVHWYELGK